MYKGQGKLRGKFPLKKQNLFFCNREIVFCVIEWKIFPLLQENKKGRLRKKF
jgi:hypothetical protein